MTLASAPWPCFGEVHGKSKAPCSPTSSLGQPGLWLGLGAGHYLGAGQSSWLHVADGWGVCNGWDPSGLFSPLPAAERVQETRRLWAWETRHETNLSSGRHSSGFSFKWDFDCRIGLKHWISILYTHPKRPGAMGVFEMNTNSSPLPAKCSIKLLTSVSTVLSFKYLCGRL
jgi:hypothetical protein